MQVSAPSGQYDPCRAINLGSHLWTIKPDVGFSKAFGALTLDFTAGRVTVNGSPATVEPANSRTGVVLAMPVDKHHSVKFSLNGGISTRTGSDFTVAAVAWQYRWADGY